MKGSEKEVSEKEGRGERRGVRREGNEKEGKGKKDRTVGGKDVGSALLAMGEGA